MVATQRMFKGYQIHVMYVFITKWVQYIVIFRQDEGCEPVAVHHRWLPSAVVVLVFLHKQLVIELR